MANPAPAPGMTSNPNQGLLIAAWICAILVPLVGLILAIIGKNKGDPRFKAPLIVSIILLALSVLWIIMSAAMFAAIAS
jgi:uncharacterized membrane protein